MPTNSGLLVHIVVHLKLLLQKNCYAKCSAPIFFKEVFSTQNKNGDFGKETSVCDINVFRQ